MLRVMRSSSVSSRFGGGLYNTQSAPNLTGSMFTGNSAVYGGGLYNVTSSASVTECSFENNTGQDAAAQSRLSTDCLPAARHPHLLTESMAMMPGTRHRHRCMDSAMKVAILACWFAPPESIS